MITLTLLSGVEIINSKIMTYIFKLELNEEELNKIKILVRWRIWLQIVTIQQMYVQHGRCYLKNNNPTTNKRLWANYLCVKNRRIPLHSGTNLNHFFISAKCTLYLNSVRSPPFVSQMSPSITTFWLLLKTIDKNNYVSQ